MATDKRGGRRVKKVSGLKRERRGHEREVKQRWMAEAKRWRSMSERGLRGHRGVRV